MKCNKRNITLILILGINFIINAQNNFNLSGEQPLTFTSMGSGTYNKSVIYHNSLYGFMIDLAKQTNNINSQPIDFRINARGGLNPFFTLKGENGNVGIGTASPSSKLQLMSGNNGFSFDANDNWEGLGFNRSVKNGQIFNTAKSAWQFTARDDRFSLEGYNGAFNNLLNVLKNGNVGIGTTTTGSHKLAVNGSIGAREIKVEVGTWSDFVFYKDYKLPTLKEVENHIKEKGHLKDIPSEKDVEENGINLGEMNAKLLQKIEELMLYTIQQEKRLIKLESQIKHIKK